MCAARCYLGANRTLVPSPTDEHRHSLRREVPPQGGETRRPPALGGSVARSGRENGESRRRDPDPLAEYFGLRKGLARQRQLRDRTRASSDHTREPQIFVAEMDLTPRRTGQSMGKKRATTLMPESDPDPRPGSPGEPGARERRRQHQGRRRGDDAQPRNQGSPCPGIRRPGLQSIDRRLAANELEKGRGRNGGDFGLAIPVNSECGGRSRLK